MSPRLLRTVSVLGGVGLAAVALLCWSQPWFVVTLSGSSAGHPDLHVAGDVSAPAVAALAVASAAGFAAMSIAGVIFRFVLAGLEFLLGGCIALSAVLALKAPVAAVEAAVTKATSVSGTESVATLIGANPATPWPFVALASGVLLALLAIAIMASARLWPQSSRRYQAARFESADARSGESAVSDWDELSGGADPTSR